MTRVLHLEHEGELAELHIDRPERLNAINLEVIAALEDALDYLEATPPLALILSSSGERAFVAGGDLKELAALTTREEAFAMAMRMERVLHRLERLPTLVLAAIDGDAYGGGCEIAVACDVRVAHAQARLGWTQIKFGLTPGWGGATRLAAIVGRSRALLWLASCAVVSVEEAERAGLIEVVAAQTSARKQAREMATHIAAQSPLAIRTLKEILSPSASARAGIRRERETFTTLWASRDHLDAVHAFFDGHPPTWKGE